MLEVYLFLQHNKIFLKQWFKSTFKTFKLQIAHFKCILVFKKVVKVNSLKVHLNDLLLLLFASTVL